MAAMMVVIPACGRFFAPSSSSSLSSSFPSIAIIARRLVSSSAHTTRRRLPIPAFESESAASVASAIPVTKAAPAPATFTGRDRTKSNGPLDRALQLLDDPALQQDRSRPIRQRGKVSKPLEKLPKLVLDKASQGMSEAIADDIMINMNEALASNTFIGVFKGVNYASEIVDISSVRLNQDYSHAHVTWTSEYMEELLRSLKQKDLAARECRYTEQMVGNINDLLQRHEGKFRSNIIRIINFRRVPRIYFQPDVKLENYLKELKYQSNIA